MVLLPKEVDTAVRYLKFQQITDRLDFLGYSSIALVHQVYGKPKDVDTDKIFDPYELILSGNKKRKRTLQVYRRLHALLENLSDVAFFTSHDHKAFDSYDLISVAPCSDAILDSVCSSALVNIITLDYTRGGLPFKLRSSHVQAAVDRNIAMEVLYGPSIHHLTHRKAMIQTIRAVESASRGKKLQLIVSSGGETNTLRMPGDIANVLMTLACLDPVQARAAQTKAPSVVLDEARRRRTGQGTTTTILSVALASQKEDDDEEGSFQSSESIGTDRTVDNVDRNNEKEGSEHGEGWGDDEDGFITL
ncbi:ribonuclease P [Fragilaria crotonensis]|nr:ribonuclease P [Fragilaria crotonensis]